MPEFRAKPIVIAAVQFIDTKLGHKDLLAFYPQGRIEPGVGRHFFRLHPSDGGGAARPGDWIVKGAKGHVSICTPDIFAATYEARDAAP